MTRSSHDDRHRGSASGLVGQTVSVAVATDGGIAGSYRSAVSLSQILKHLGCELNPAIDALIDTNDYFVQFSHEDLELIDADLLMWIDGHGHTAEIE